MTEVHHADKVYEASTSQDHDTLVRIETKVERAIDDIKELKDGTAIKISNLEATRATTSELASLRIRVAWLERIAYIGLGIIYAIETYYRLK